MKKRDDIPVLHGIRGLLALWVLLGHTMDACGGFFPVLSAPGVAVYAFMVMSGFLMALHFRLREDREPWAEPKTWLLFLVRRFFRIAPVYYLALLIAYLFHQPYMHYYYAMQAQFPLWFIHPPGAIIPFDIKSLLLHATFLFGLFPSTANNNILPDWSIGLEMQFYFAFPFLMLLYQRVGAVWFSLICAGIAAAGWKMAPTFPQPAFLPLTVTVFVVGILMSEAYLVSDRLKSALLLALAVCLATVHAPSMFQVIVVGMMLLINFPTLFDKLKIAFFLRPIENLLGGRFGRFVGDRSYSVYLIHMLVLVPVVTLLARLPWFVHAHPFARFGIVASVMLAICYSLASLIAVLVEKPGIVLGHRVAARWRASSGT